MSTDPISGVICHLCGAPHKSNFLDTSMVIRGGGVRGIILNYYVWTSLDSFVHDWTLSVGLCVQKALVSCDQPADALCTIVSITDNHLGAILRGAIHNNTVMHPSVRTSFPFNNLMGSFH